MGKSRAWVERPDADAMILGPRGQQAVCSEGHAVDNSTVEGQHGQGLHGPPVKHADPVVPARGGQDLPVRPDLDVRDPRIGEFMSPAHLQHRERQSRWGAPIANVPPTPASSEQDGSVGATQTHPFLWEQLAEGSGLTPALSQTLGISGRIRNLPSESRGPTELSPAQGLLRIWGL